MFNDNNVLPDSIFSFKHLGISVREQFKIDGLPYDLRDDIENQLSDER